MRTVKAGVLYFAIVFAAGFVLGAIRTLWIVPRLGTRAAELMEAPSMLVVTIVVARWVVRRFVPTAAKTSKLGAGCVGLAFLLTAEFTVVLAIRHLTLREYIASRDPIAGMVYLLLLGLFAIMPLLV